MALETYEVTNNGQHTIEAGEPYTAHITVRGVAPILFHAWNVESVAEKGKAPKGSKAKKEDDYQSYVYRTPDGELAIPTEYFRQAVIGAARFRQDPRSPRKSAIDLFKAGIVGLQELCPLGTNEWDYLDRRRVTIQRSAITRVRPALNPGWETTVVLGVVLPEYIEPATLNEVIAQAGRLIGVADYRPTYGRFQIVGFAVGPA